MKRPTLSPSLLARTASLAPMIALAAALTSCSSGWRAPLGQEASDEDAAATTPEGPPKPRYGCLQGVVIDGISGERLDLPAGPDDGVRVLVGTKLLPATPSGDAAANPQLKGEYTLCDVPLEDFFPIFAFFPGYQRFEGYVGVPATSRATSDTAVRDRYSKAPTAQANLRLFPVATSTQAYTVTVSSNGQPLANAHVILTPTGFNALAQGAGFVVPHPATHRALSGISDGGGNVVFPAADLTLGAIYRWQVLPPDGGAVKRAASGTATIGYLTEPGLPYTLRVDLADTDTDLVVVSTSLDDRHYSEDGSISYAFNRPVELVPGTTDAITAALQSGLGAELVPEDSAVVNSERVSVVITGDQMLIRPVFKTPPDKAREPALGIQYSGIQVRPAVGDKLLHTLMIEPFVSVYGGAKAPPVASTMVIVGGNEQQGSPSDQLTQQLGVMVTDQYGDPVKGVTVTFDVVTGGGMLSPGQTLTNTAGIAQVRWTLGASGPQKVSAALDDDLRVPPVAFTAIFLNAATMTIISGDVQKARPTVKLANALTVRLVDDNSVAVSDVAVTFTVDGATGGTVQETGGTGAAVVTVTTGANGQAAVEWTLGAVGGDFTVTASAGGLNRVFHAQALVPTTIVKVSGDAQSALAGATLTNPLIAEVRDQNGTAMSGIDAQVATTATASTLQIGAGAPAPTVSGQTSTAGRLSVVWKLGTTLGAQTTSVTVVGITNPAVFGATAN